MAINALQPILRGATGKELQFTGDFHAYWDQLGIPPGQFAERMAAWKALPQNAAWIDATEDADAAVVVEGLWRNGEQGVWLDPSDLSTMFQDAGGSLPVYMPGSGQVDPPVGLMLDKRFALAKGPEVWQDASVMLFGEASRVSPGVYRVYTSAGAYSAIQIAGLIAGDLYELSLNVDSITTLGNGLACDVTAPAISFATLGPKRYLLRPNSDIIAIKRNANVLTDIQVSNVSVRRVPGNHATQATTTSRPTLSARYNLLTNTAWTGGTTGTPGTAPSGWSIGFGTAAISAIELLNGDNLITFSAAGTRTFLTQAFTAAINTTYSIVCRLRATTGVAVGQLLGLTSQPSGSTFLFYINGALADQNAVPPANATIELRLFNGATAGTPAARFGLGTIGNVTGTVSLMQPDVRVSNDGVGLPPYQYVLDATIYSVVGFPLYLRFDGTDDFLQTGSVDFSAASSVTAAAAVRKLSDAARGIIFELGTQGYGQPGSFNFEQAWFSPNFSASHSGASGSATTTKPGIGSPASAVLSAVFDQAASLVRLRYQGQEASQNATAVGGGGYLNAVIYIGRRGGASSPASMRLYGMVLRGGASNNAQISAIEKLLNQKARIY